MRKWNVVALVVAVLVATSPFATAQSEGGDLRQELNQLKARLATVEAQNNELRNKVEGENSLESQINALAENLDYAAGTTVNSVANPITFTGIARARTGWTTDRDFGRTDNDDDGSFTEARFYVGMDFDLDRDVRVHIGLQAAGNFDNDDTPAGSDSLSDIDLYDGWILIQNIFGRKELSARTGRQEIVLGNEFIFGNNDFFDGETHDGTHWWWDNENFTLHFLMMIFDSGDVHSTRNWDYASATAGNFGHDDDEMYSLYFTLKSIENHTLDLYWVYFNGNAPFGGTSNTQLTGLTGGAGANAFFHVIGFRLEGLFPSVASGLDYNIELAYETGTLETAGGDVDMDGLTIEFEVGITFNAENHFRIFLRLLYAEGSDGSDTGFVTLFPERHANANRDDHTAYRARYGLMDIIPMENVLTIQLGLTFDPAADWTVGATFIYAEYDEDVAVVGGTTTDLGWEIDLFAEYRYSDQTTLSAGLGVFFADDGAPLVGGGTAGNDDDVAVLFYLETLVIF